MNTIVAQDVLPDALFQRVPRFETEPDVILAGHVFLIGAMNLQELAGIVGKHLSAAE